MYNKALYPTFEQLQTFFIVFKVRLLAHVNFIWYKSLLLILHSLEPFFERDLDHRRSDHSHFKMISATAIVIFATEVVITATYLSHYKSDLDPSRKHHSHIKNHSSHHKSDLGHKQTALIH